MVLFGGGLMAKEWISMEKVISENTNQEIIKELYLDGATAQYSKRLKEINDAIKKENQEKELRKAKRKK